MTAQSATAMQPRKETVPVRQGPGDLLVEFHRLRDLVARRAFALFEGNHRWPGDEIADWLQAESEILHPLHLELSETDNAFTVRAEVPGFTAKDLEIEVEPHCLRIAGERETHEEGKKGKTIRSECCATRIMRSLELPADIALNKVTANLKDGLITIDLPKAAPAKSVPIRVKAS